VAAALELGAMGVASVKPARLGGLAAAADVLASCARRGVPAFCGGMLELGVGRAAAAAVAALEACSLPTDLGPSSQYVERDVAGPVDVDEDGRLVVPAGPGLGATPDRARLRAVSEAVLELGA
jgi:O-succinylbenzoate synthase